MTVQPLASRPEDLAYALMADNEAVRHVDRMRCIECAPDAQFDRFKKH